MQINIYVIWSRFLILFVYRHATLLALHLKSKSCLLVVMCGKVWGLTWLFGVYCVRSAPFVLLKYQFAALEVEHGQVQGDETCYGQHG
jgi:hypothetical protein